MLPIPCISTILTKGGGNNGFHLGKYRLPLAEITASTRGNKSFRFEIHGNNDFPSPKQAEITISGENFVKIKISQTSSINISEQIN